MQGSESQNEILKLDQKNYKVPEGEEHVYHTRIEVKKFDSDSGNRISVPRVQKFGVKAFKRHREAMRKQGFTVDVLYDPSNFLTKRREAAGKARYVRAEKTKEALEARKKAEKEALIAEIREELLAELKAEPAKQGAKKPEPKKDGKKEDEGDLL